MQAIWSTLLSFDYNLKSPTIPASGIIGEIFEYISNYFITGNLGNPGSPGNPGKGLRGLNGSRIGFPGQSIMPPAT